MAEKEIPKITDRNTKTEILKAYDVVAKRLEDLAKVNIDPVAEAATICNKAIKRQVESVSPARMGEAMETLDKSMNKVVAQLGVYDQINKAIDIQNAELEEMFSIKKNAYTLAALINSQSEVRERFEEEMKAKKSQADENLKLVTADLEKWTKDFDADLSRTTADMKESRKKELEDYKYTFAREKKIAGDDFKDTMNKKKRELEAEIDTARKEVHEYEKRICQREQDVAIKEDVNSEMNDKIAEFPKVLEAAIKEAEKKGRASEAVSCGFETRYLKKEQEGALALLEAKLETMTQALDAEKVINANLTSTVDDAYARIEALASKTVDGASNVKLVSTLETALREKNTASSK